MSPFDPKQESDEWIKNPVIEGHRACSKCKGKGIRERSEVVDRGNSPITDSGMWYIECAWCGNRSKPDWEYSVAWKNWDLENPRNIWVDEILAET